MKVPVAPPSSVGLVLYVMELYEDVSAGLQTETVQNGFCFVDGKGWMSRNTNVCGWKHPFQRLTCAIRDVLLHTSVAVTGCLSSCCLSIILKQPDDEVTFQIAALWLADILYCIILDKFNLLLVQTTNAVQVSPLAPWKHWLPNPVSRQHTHWLHC